MRLKDCEQSRNSTNQKASSESLKEEPQTFTFHLFIFITTFCICNTDTTHGTRLIESSLTHKTTSEGLLWDWTKHNQSTDSYQLVASLGMLVENRSLSWAALQFVWTVARWIESATESAARAQISILTISPTSFCLQHPVCLTSILLINSVVFSWGFHPDPRGWGPVSPRKRNRCEWQLSSLQYANQSTQNSYQEHLSKMHTSLCSKQLVLWRSEIRRWTVVF